ncbi:PEP-CTERM sorting domain-containing protein [Thiobacillus sedimenti]|uniref:PEP-CTERM sorting domain-containing protein n=1 Tax=Thiobacillus sedimenti TaxID=3110231 RepID=A0ABZ1CGW7_9PROT|nr:PEP-CTERM sorting domain-containing protein [Thiobacillus sp. SCUT-2]WRS38345.1 PEP-CTERM sorting domain-containing protein [Thiobacillus sp. SCUT-2]
MLTLRQVFSGISLLAAASAAQAAIITLNGDHFTVTYDEALVSPLFGSGALSGSLDTLYFQPTAFNAFGAGASAATKASLQFTVAVDSGYAFAGLAFSEWGNYFLSDGGSASAAAVVQATNSATSDSGTLNLTPGSPLDVAGGTANWALSGLISPTGLGSPQSLLVSLGDQVGVDPSAGGLGYIEKNYVGFRIMTQAQSVPEPSTGALLFGGVLAALLAGRRPLGGPLKKRIEDSRKA